MDDVAKDATDKTNDSKDKGSNVKSSNDKGSSGKAGGSNVIPPAAAGGRAKSRTVGEASGAHKRAGSDGEPASRPPAVP